MRPRPADLKGRAPRLTARADRSVAVRTRPPLSTGEWCRKHPHDSFAPVRKHQGARWLVDGAAYFGAVADAVEAACHIIYIADWWLSPEACARGGGFAADPPASR